MIIEVDNEREYIPAWNNNRQGDEPIKITHRFLKAGERKKFIYTKPIRLNVGEGTVSDEVDYIQDQEGIAKALITKIENLKVKDKKSDKVIEVKDINTFYQTSGIPQALVSEIENYILTASPEVDTDFL